LRLTFGGINYKYKYIRNIQIVIMLYNLYMLIKTIKNKEVEMKEYREITRKRLLLSMVTHPIFIFVYWISFYELYTLCMFGKINNNIIILVICMLFFLAWFILVIIRIIKEPATKPKPTLDKFKFYEVRWPYIAIITIVLITSVYGVKIYNSAINFNGKLSWYLHDLENKKTINLEHNNIYDSGIEGIFADINKEVQMPENLYVSDSFSLKFDSNGIVTSFDTYLYGKNDKDELESYLISYDSSKSEKITVYLNGYVNVNYSKDKLLKPLIDTMKVIKLKETVIKWDENQYGILYSGKRNWGYNTDGIVYLDSKGNTKTTSNSFSEIIGYTVSVFVVGKEDKYTPVRYNLENITVVDPSKVYKDENSSKNIDNDTESYQSKEVGYHLKVTDAAMGSRAYSLEGTSNGGGTWETLNADPFSGEIGVAAGITFINDKLGFLCLSHSGGSNAALYRTEDGGLSYKKIALPEVKVKLIDEQTYNPFDFPKMPYEEDGILNILVGQGADGDYNGGCKALYQSKDEGKTWEYIKEANIN